MELTKKQIEKLTMAAKIFDGQEFSMIEKLIEFDDRIEKIEQLKVGGKFLKGDKGDQGDKGDMGPQGYKGDSIIGPAGRNGENGRNGESITGPQGPIGPMGKIPHDIIETINFLLKKVEYLEEELKKKPKVVYQGNTSGASHGANVSVNGIDKGLARYINFVAGTNMTITHSLVGETSVLTFASTGSAAATNYLLDDSGNILTDDSGNRLTQT